MKEFDKIIFAGKTGTCREPMAMELLKGNVLQHPAEIEAKGIVVLFPEPINQKAEAVMISNGIKMEDYMTTQLTAEDFSEHTLVIVFEQEEKNQIFHMYENAQNVHVLTDLTGEELEILDPYGSELVLYGMCFETLVKTIRKLVDVLNEGTYFDTLPQEEPIQEEQTEETTTEVSES